MHRRIPVGAELVRGGVHFRVWAPKRSRVDVMVEGGEERVVPLEKEGSGYFSRFVESLEAGARYKYRLDAGDSFPDPASRFQPEGPHFASEIVDPSAFPWTDSKWQGVTLEGQVIYEMHIGTFTKEGTWSSAAAELRHLAETGITVLEVMPVAEFPGRFGWGYDGVHMFAPTHLYGSPDAFRNFVNSAHSLGMGVILDVVYNHFGPDGNYLPEFSACYFSDTKHTDWGAAINFDGHDCGAVREFCIANAGYWIDEFHLDGLRLDATQDIHDSSGDHILRAIAREVRQKAKPRKAILVAENEPQNVQLIESPEQAGYGLDARAGYGLDALWNDDFHHSAMVALTGRNEAYYSDYLGKPQEFISAVKYGFLYQGQRYSWQKQRRGSAGLHLQPASKVIFIQNHDQVANSAYGARCHTLTDPGRLRAITALFLLAPATPMLFQGQEFGSSTPFLYFADHEPKLADMVRKGRCEFLAQFPSLATKEMAGLFADPADPATFERCKLDHAERNTHAAIYVLHCDLLRLRREEPVFRAQRNHGVDGAVLAEEAFLLRFFGEKEDDRLLLVNFGADLHLNPAPEPLLAPPRGQEWTILWSSENPKYGGTGTPPLDTEDNWRIPGHAAVVLKPVALKPERTA
jgi:maltooligosyltrehalose trehalohydrolase